MSRFVQNPYRQLNPQWDADLCAAFEDRDIVGLHRSIEEYRSTPLVELPALAACLGIGRLLVKDEAHRFGLKAFKALGATYATYRYLQSYLAEREQPCPAASEFYRTGNVLNDDELTFCTASDGNHGRGVAWTARKLGQKAVIYMPTGTVPTRIENIRGEGAEVIVVDGTYDDAVRRCTEIAAANDWQVISDTSWPGYEEIPRRIMAGYLTLFHEIEADIDRTVRFDVIFLQGGVGALAGAAAWYFRKVGPEPGPKLVMVEPMEAACLLESIDSAKGEPVMSHGKQDSIMAGLNCGFPSAVSWPLVKMGYDAFLTVSDDYCVRAMRSYYYPKGRDPEIVSGESGAAGLAALLTLMSSNSLAEARSSLGLDGNATVLLLNTEGDTDPMSFRRMVRDIPP